MLAHEFVFRGDMVRYGVHGAGEPLVLVHGTPFSSAVWTRLLPWLAAERRVFVYDLLGYGASTMRDGQDVSLGVQNGLLAALIEHWGLERPHVVGHDFGGATSLRAHLLDGRDYASLTLIDPVALAPWGSPFVRHVRNHEAAFAGMPGYAHEALVAAYLRGAVHRSMGDVDLEPHLAPWRGEAGQAGFYRQIAQMDQRWTDEIEPLLSAVRCPVQILWGEEDRWIPIAQGRRLAERVAGASFHPVAGAGHLVQEDRPEAIVARLAAFLPGRAAG